MPEDQATEISHVKQALRDNGYPNWIFKIPEKKQTDRPKNNTAERVYHPTAVIPYIRGLSEQLERAYAKHGVSIIHKPSNTIRQMLVQPKDKTSHLEKCGAVYLIKCNDCEDNYIGETARALSTRLNEHQKTWVEPPTLTSVGEHLRDTRHQHRGH